MAIEPKTKAGQEKMGIALAKLAEEDPTFKTYTDEETGQTIIAGMGELHLEIIVDRLLREFKVEANVGAPQVAYKETIRKAVDQETKYARQSGGKGQYGHVKIHVEPNEPGKGYEFLNSVVGGAIPKEYIPAVDAGIQGAMQAGVMAGFPVVDVKVTLYDGSFHEVDSSEMAFKIAGSMAFKEACRKANPTILEPIMKVAVVVPDDYMGRRHRRHFRPPGQHPGYDSPATAPPRSTPTCRWPRCSVTPPICGAKPRAGASTPWSPATMRSCPNPRVRRSSPSGPADKFFLPFCLICSRIEAVLAVTCHVFYFTYQK